jgi:glycosyltransferase involved in cell wall biosynthesis
MRWLFAGPTLLAGIGQVTNRYVSLMRAAGHEAEYVQFGQKPAKTRYTNGFAFVLPIEQQLGLVDEYAKLCDNMIYMTICETSKVNPVYGILARYKTLYVASDFCKDVFSRQFPTIEWKVLRLYAEPKVSKPPAPGPYVFYTIGNVNDPRKNMKGLIEAYIRCQFGNKAHLLVKATCIDEVTWKFPNVTIINGLLSDEDMEKVHNAGHCYINCSHSEGVGMGAVEAALRSKPVIITDYGGLKEYVKTPWVIPAPPGPIGFDDFLFTKELEWGQPKTSDLRAAMQDCFERRVTSWNHLHTRDIMTHLSSLSTLAAH